MMNLEDIHSLTDFQRNTQKHIKRLRSTGRPGVLTIKGQARLVVQDAKSYQAMQNRYKTLMDLRRLDLRQKSIDEGLGIPEDDFFERLDRFIERRTSNHV